MDTLDAVLAAGAVTPFFQPIVDLGTGEVVGHEALSRGPVGGPLHEAGALFGAAARADRLPELDALCRVRAVRAAAEAGMRSPNRLFVNVEPTAIAAGTATITWFARWRDRGIPIVLELTERALTRDPAALLAYAEQAHAEGLPIAVDDVGAVPESLALLPLLQPEVVKLDLRLVQQRPDADVASIMTAVTAYAERTGALVLAEGVETERHERVARSLGATLGQGFRFGRPSPVPPWARAVSPARRPIEVSRPVPPDLPVGPGADGPPPVPGAPGSPFETVARVRPSQTARKDLLVEVSKLLERQATEMGGLAVVLAAFEVAGHLTPSTRRRYAQLAECAAFVVVLGAGMPAEPAPGLRGASLGPDDPVGREWDVLVVGPHFSAALVARDRHDGRPERERMFDYVLTYDRPLVLEAARSLMRRALPAPASGPVAAGGRRPGRAVTTGTPRTRLPRTATRRTGTPV